VKATAKEIDRRVVKAQTFVAAQARLRGEQEAAARQQGAQAAEATFEQLRKRR
jgi:hypothetical protein